MENNSTKPLQENKQWMSPRIIIAAVILILIIVLAAYFMNQKSSNLPDSAAPTPQPKESAVQEPDASTASETQNGEVKQFIIDGSNFKFTPNTINVNEGDTVKITFKNTQGFHNFLLDEFNVKSKTIPVDQTDEISFIASKKGTFQFYCSVGSHKAMGMVGTLTVR